MHNNCVIVFTVFPHKKGTQEFKYQFDFKPGHSFSWSLPEPLPSPENVGGEVVEHSWELAICCLSSSKLCGRESRTEHGRKSKVDTHTHKQPNEPRAGASFWSQTSVDVVLISFSPPPSIFTPLSMERSLMMSLVTRATSHQHFEAHRHRGVHTHTCIYTPHTLTHSGQQLVALPTVSPWLEGDMGSRCDSILPDRSGRRKQEPAD